MLPKIIEVKPLQDFILYLHYSNGEIRYINMQPYLDFGIFKELNDIQIFKTVRVVFDTIEWSNGADLDPCFIYKNSMPNIDELMLLSVANI